MAGYDKFPEDQCTVHEMESASEESQNCLHPDCGHHPTADRSNQALEVGRSPDTDLYQEWKEQDE